MTGVRCRFVTIVAGALLILLSLLPKAFLIASIALDPDRYRDQDPPGSRHRDRRNQLLVAVSVGFGLIPVVRPELRADAAVDGAHHPQTISPGSTT